jgi:hypothetical protein
MPKVKKLKRNSKISVVIIIIASILLMYLLTYYISNGFSANDFIFNTHEDARIMINSPPDAKGYYHYDDIDISGGMWGGVPDVVRVWNTRFNVPVVCTLSANNFYVTIPASDLSKGMHTMAAQGRTTDGRWTPIVYFRINKLDVGPDMMNQFLGMENNNMENLLPGVLGGLFRPVEDIVKGIVVVVSGGTASDDLNGDNIPDELQQSPFAPRHNPMNMPLMAALVFGLIILVIIVILFVVVKPIMDARKKVVSKPDYLDYKLREKEIGLEKTKQDLRQERIKRQKLEKQVEEEKKKHRKPVNIYMDGRKKKSITDNKKAKVKETDDEQKVLINLNDKKKKRGLLSRLRRK